MCIYKVVMVNASGVVKIIIKQLMLKLSLHDPDVHQEVGTGSRL